MDMLDGFNRILRQPWQRKGTFLYTLNTSNRRGINLFSLNVQNQRAAGTTENDAMRLAALIQMLPRIVKFLDLCGNPSTMLANYALAQELRTELNTLIENANREGPEQFACNECGNLDLVFGPDDKRNLKEGETWCFMCETGVKLRN